MKSIRFSTLARKYGPVTRADQCTDAEWQQAKDERRFMTVYHAEDDWCTPVLGMVGHHGCVNTLCKLVFARPLPPEITKVTGLRNNAEAFQLCNP